jgi:DNA repair protein RadA/Sms
MSKPLRSGFRCTECGATTPQWVGRCPECQAWGAVSEPHSARPGITLPELSRHAAPIGELDPEPSRARPTGVGELDRVLGGGLVPGSVVLLAGEPGVGKSTLLLAAAHQWASAGGSVLIVTGEESAGQVRLRAERTGAVAARLFLAAETELAALLAQVEHVNPDLLIVDSVQTIHTASLDGGVGGVPQIRAVAAALIGAAKQRGMATVIVGHVTKDGSIAGPRLLEHLVDVVLMFEGDRHSSLRLVRATKNRFGPAEEIGCFEMREDGIVGLADPSRLFLSERSVEVPGTCVAVTVEGRRPMVTEVQALVTRSAGQPRRAVTGLDGSRVAMLIAVLTRHGGTTLGDHDVYAATVGGIQASEPAADLAVALAVASAAREIRLPRTLCAIGEVSLSGEVRHVPNLQRRLAEAARLGFRTALVPPGHPDEPAASCPTASITAVPVGTLQAALSSASSVSHGLLPGRPALRVAAGT